MPQLRIGAATVAATGLLITCVLPAQAAPETARPPSHYTEQHIDWHRCAADELPDPAPPASKHLLCGQFRAPRDWNNPHQGRDITIAVSKLPSKTRAASRTVVTNPGGPGAPGRTFPLRLRGQERLRAAFDVIGFDPRGTGKSTTITCGGAISDLDPLDPRDRSARNLDRILDTTADTARACRERSRPLGAFVNTFQTVHDIDLLRRLLNRDKISWIGYSAGTWLGAHYATRFPRRVDRVVLDSSVEFTTDWQRSFDWQPLGFERRWRADFLPWIARYDSIYGFGSTAVRARLTYEDVRAALQDEPVKLGDQAIGPNEFDMQIAGALYSKKSFPDLADYLVAIRAEVEERSEGHAGRSNTDFVPSLGALRPGPRPLVVPSESDDSYLASFWTIPCNDTAWRGDRASVVSQSQKLGSRYPLLGWGWVVQPCIFWETEPTSLPTPTGRGLPPVLIVQSTHDPATPIEGARRAHARFAGSAMLTVINEGDHGLYAGGNGCVDTVVERYLVDNRKPVDRACPGMPLPVPDETRMTAPA